MKGLIFNTVQNIRKKNYIFFYTFVKQDNEHNLNLLWNMLCTRVISFFFLFSYFITWEKKWKQLHLSNIKSLQSIDLPPVPPQLTGLKVHDFLLFFFAQIHRSVVNKWFGTITGHQSTTFLLLGKETAHLTKHLFCQPFCIIHPTAKFSFYVSLIHEDRDLTLTTYKCPGILRIF